MLVVTVCWSRWSKAVSFKDPPMKQEEYECYSVLALSTRLFSAGCHTALLFHTERALSLGRYTGCLVCSLNHLGPIFI